MKKAQARLEAREEIPKIKGRCEKNFENGGNNGRFYGGAKRRRILRKWYVLYLSTTLAAVAAVTLMLLFGTGAGNAPLHEGIGGFADKIADVFTRLDFPHSATHGGENGKDGNDGKDFIALPSGGDSAPKDTEGENNGGDGAVSVAKPSGLYGFDYSAVPEGCTPIIPMDLSLSSFGSQYINNSTGYSPDIGALLKKELGADKGYTPLAASQSPLVLIIHTHGTEAYSADGALYCKDTDNYARTADAGKSVVAVGAQMSEVLNKNGIPTVHCTVMHDSVQYKDSYARAEETVKKYLSEYPSIKLVIDIHRDSIVKSTGELVRPVAEINGEAAAQVMCVVGSDWAGDDCPNWENNLSLALKLREGLNEKYGNICRPVFLKGNTYNQELSAYSLLIEVGSSGNSLEEALRSATVTAEALAMLVKQI